MISNRELRNRLQQSTDESFSTPSSTLMERLPQLAKASADTSPPVVIRAGRRIAGTLASIGLIGWLTMGGAGAIMTVAAVGDLPDPVQQFVADVVEVVGIDLPDPEEERLSVVREPGDPQSGSISGSTSSSSVAGERGVNGQGLASSGDGQSSSPGNSGNAPGQSSSPGNSGNASRRGSTGTSAIAF